jgi:hypothetical protein
VTRLPTIQTTGNPPRLYINWRLPFKTRGTLRAAAFAPGEAPLIQLPPSFHGEVIRRKPWNIYTGRRRQIVYVVYSYDVPIAWAYADGSVERPGEWYSSTTNRHQQIAAALTDPQGFYGALPE